MITSASPKEAFKTRKAKTNALTKTKTPAGSKDPTHQHSHPRLIRMRFCAGESLELCSLCEEEADIWSFVPTVCVVVAKKKIWLSKDFETKQRNINTKCAFSQRGWEGRRVPKRVFFSSELSFQFPSACRIIMTAENSRNREEITFGKAERLKCVLHLLNLCN